MDAIHDLFHTDVPVWILIFRAATVFIVLLFLLRLAGKRQVASLGLPDFIALLLISNAVQNSMNGGDNSLVGGLMMAVVLVLLSNGCQYATYRSRKFERLVQGSPTLLIHHGKIIEKHMERELLSHRELHAMLRKQGVHSLDEVAEAVLESDGYVSIIRKGEPMPADARKELLDDCDQCAAGA